MNERGDMKRMRIERGPEKEELFFPQHFLRKRAGRGCKASRKGMALGRQLLYQHREKRQASCTRKKRGRI